MCTALELLHQCWCSAKWEDPIQGGPPHMQELEPVNQHPQQPSQPFRLSPHTVLHWTAASQGQDLLLATGLAPTNTVHVFSFYLINKPLRAVLASYPCFTDKWSLEVEQLSKVTQLVNARAGWAGGGGRWCGTRVTQTGHQYSKPRSIESKGYTLDHRIFPALFSPEFL